MFEKKKSKIEDINVNSKSNIDNHYVKYLIDNINNINIRNIAIVGPYGSGKTSIVRSFLMKKDKKFKHTIFISRDSFKRINTTQIENMKFSLYLELLKHNSKYQSYKELCNSLMKNEMNDLNMGKTLIFIFRILYLLFNVSSSLLVAFLVNRILNSMPISILSAITIFGMLWLLFFVCKAISYKKIRLDVKDFIGISTNERDNSIYKNQIDRIKANPVFYENAIINIVKNEKIRYVIVEDMERETQNENFNKTLDEIKKISDIVNTSRGLENQIKFIFCINDDNFYNAEERLKNFDFLIPILPISTLGSSFDTIIENKIVKKKEISTKTISIIAPYFYNMRMISALLSEFDLLTRDFGEQNLDWNQIFTLASLHILFPNFYSKLFNSENLFEKIFEYQRKNNTQMIEDVLKDLNVKNYITEAANICKITGTSFNDFKSFITTIIVRKLITQNYRTYISNNSKNTLSLNDINVIKKYNNLETINSAPIDDPQKFIDYVNQTKPCLLFNNYKLLNYYVLLHIINHYVEYKNELEIVKNTLSQNIDFAIQLFKDIIILSEAKKPYYNTKLIIDIFRDNSSLYYSFSKLDYSIKLSVIKFFMNCLDIKNQKQNAFELSKIDNIYLVAISNIKNIEFEDSGFEYFSNKKVFEDLTIFDIEKRQHIFNILKENNHYIPNYNNVKVLYPNIEDTPMQTLIKNPNLFKNVFSKEEYYKDIFDSCSGNETVGWLIDFIRYVSINIVKNILKYDFFKKYRFSIDISEIGNQELINACFVNLIIKFNDDYYNRVMNNSNYLSAYKNILIERIEVFKEMNYKIPDNILCSCFFTESEFVKKIEDLIEWDKFNDIGEKRNPEFYAIAFGHLNSQNQKSLIDSIIRKHDINTFDAISNNQNYYPILTRMDISFTYDWYKFYLMSQNNSLNSLKLFKREEFNDVVLKDIYDKKIQSLLHKENYVKLCKIMK